MFTSDKTTAASKAVLNPFTSKPGTILLIIIKSMALITKVNNPNVKILIGNVNNISIGLIIKVNIPHTTETTTKVCQPLIIKPLTKYAVI